MLFIILALSKQNTNSSNKGSWRAAFYLFIYAACFSYAYIRLDTGVGALVLFSAVQITMILVSMFSGNKLHTSEWFGMLIAFAGFVYLVLPNLSTPSFSGFLLMSLAGIAWGFYTLAGKASRQPLVDTSFNFLRTLPFVILFSLFTWQSIEISAFGILMAILSGGIASGVGYTIWYIALRGLNAAQAAVLQLLVPVIATLGGVIFSGEQVNLQFVLAAIIILGGILIVILGKQIATQLSTK